MITLDSMDIDTLVDAFFSNGALETCKIMSYSGRAMYGKECLGIRSDDPDFLGELIHTLVDDWSNDVAALLTGNRYLQDNLGRGYITYWPNLGLPEDFVDDTDDEDDE